MRILGRVTLLLGIAVVAAMAWYGAMALFEDDEPTRVIEAEERACEAAPMSRAEDAQRVFVRKYVDGGGNDAWFSGVGISHTRVQDTIIEQQRSVFGLVVQPVDGKGAFVMVMQVPGTSAPELPLCLRGVPIVVTFGGRAVAL